MSRRHEPVTAPEKLAAALAEAQSWSRVGSQGGYPDDFCFIDDLIVVASLVHDVEPVLIVRTVPDYLVDNECWLEDDAELQELFDRCCADPEFKRQISASRWRQKNAHAVFDAACGIPPKPETLQ